MTNRELSERLEALAIKLEEIVDSDSPQAVWEVAQELRKLSTEKYTPGSTSWADLQQQLKKPTKKTYTDKQGRSLPF